jgi:hypothetical protein
MCRPEYSMSASVGCVRLGSFASHPTSGAGLDAARHRGNMAARGYYHEADEVTQ